MKLLGSGFTTAASTFAGVTGGSGTFHGSTVQSQSKGFEIQKIVAFGASSVAPNTSGGIKFRWGLSSGQVESTLVVLPGPSSVGLVVELSGLDLEANWFQAETNEAGAGGYGIFVMGK